MTTEDDTRKDMQESATLAERLSELNVENMGDRSSEGALGSIMCDDTIDIEERMREARRRRLKDSIMEQDKWNRELLSRVLKQLRLYLVDISKEASVRAREAKRQEEYGEICREERRMQKEQYPCDNKDEMHFQSEFRFEWM